MANNIDLEQGNPAADANALRADLYRGLPETGNEYSQLNRYISHNDEVPGGEAGSTKDSEKEAEEEQPKKSWWKRAGPADTSKFVTPPDWLNTDIRTGLSSSDVEPRRHKTGWNELESAHVNPILQFIGYFRGPILYGMFT